MDKNEFIPAAADTDENALVDLGAASVETKGMLITFDEEEGRVDTGALAE